MDNFRLVQLINRVRGVIRNRAVMARWHAGGGDEPGIAYGVYQEPASPLWQEAWAVTEDLLRMMRDEAARQGARLLVVGVTAGQQVDPDASVRRDLERRLGVPDLSYPDRRLEAFGEQEKIPVLTLATAFLRQAERTGVPLHGFGDHRGKGHWNEQGHHLAGTEIARWICAGAVPATPSPRR